MFIAFEGPDKTGKSTSANNLSHDGKAFYNATKEGHEEVRRDYYTEPDLVVTYDRIDWLTHMTYRLALPDHEWNDERVRTVFAMPDTHLVFKLHQDAVGISDELYEVGKLVAVNDAYQKAAEWLIDLNKHMFFTLFKTITVIEVSRVDGEFIQRLVDFSSPVFEYLDVARNTVKDDQTLLELLEYEDTKRL